MKEIKYRIPHYSYKDKFRGFSYWGRINTTNGKHSFETFTGPVSWVSTISKTDEQYILLKDINKKELYENDICESGNGAQFVIVFENGRFKGKGIKLGKNYFKDCKLIGNKHTHPALYSFIVNSKNTS